MNATQDPAEEQESREDGPTRSGEDAAENASAADEAAPEEGEAGNGEKDSQKDNEEQVPSLEEELEKWRDLAARSRAELENFRKRMAREKTEAIVYANRGLLESLLPIVDNFEMGLQAARDNDGEDSVIYQGMAMVHRQLGDLLKDQGVEEVPTDGEPFDPNCHEAVQQQPDDEVPEGTVLSTLRRGYRLRDRVLRAANVVVSSGPSDDGEGAD